jgi:hypothetical protein
MLQTASVDHLSWLLTTMLNSCGHETSDWPLLYKSDPEFGHTYNTLLEGKQVPNFHL